ncbi:MAG: thermonuclease family protein [Nitrospinae bacterium]|nr:thermonuclease family protein [Nitrospinota bacterium]
MRPIRIVLMQVIWMLLIFTFCKAEAADRKELVKLTGCQYVEHNYNDGDSFHVKCGINEFILRLYFIDAPETNLRFPERTREQSEYFGVTLDETMKAGVKAKQTVRDILREPFVMWTRWATAQGRSRVPRYYGFVEIGGKGLAELLISKGLARTKGVKSKLPTGEKSKVYLERLYALEHKAQQRGIGIWAGIKK